MQTGCRSGLCLWWVPRLNENWRKILDPILVIIQFKINTLDIKLCYAGHAQDLCEEVMRHGLRIETNLRVFVMENVTTFSSITCQRHLLFWAINTSVLSGRTWTNLSWFSCKTNLRRRWVKWNKKKPNSPVESVWCDVFVDQLPFSPKVHRAVQLWHQRKERARLQSHLQNVCLRLNGSSLLTARWQKMWKVGLHSRVEAERPSSITST